MDSRRIEQTLLMIQAARQEVFLIISSPITKSEAEFLNQAYACLDDAADAVDELLHMGDEK